MQLKPGLLQHRRGTDLVSRKGTKEHDEYDDGYGHDMGTAMMLAMGLFGLLIVIVLVLAIIALVKYLTSGPK